MVLKSKRIIIFKLKNKKSSETSTEKFVTWTILLIYFNFGLVLFSQSVRDHKEPEFQIEWYQASQSNYWPSF